MWYYDEEIFSPRKTRKINGLIPVKNSFKIILWISPSNSVNSVDKWFLNSPLQGVGGKRLQDKRYFGALHLKAFILHQCYRYYAALQLKSDLIRMIQQKITSFTTDHTENTDFF
jgi:hypothetical protein